MRSDDGRVRFLDGFRGLAIIGVVIYHYYYNFPGFFPVGYERVPLAKYGGLGVMLFFTVSGFVIAMSLVGARDAYAFASRRFARLFPAMLVCSAVTYLASFVGPATYRSTLGNFLPSLTFVDPRLFNWLLGTHDIDWMDGAYWSLFAEVRFYAIAATIYFFDRDRFVRNFMALAIVVGVAFPVAILLQLDGARRLLSLLFVANHLPWFTLGIGFYCLHESRRLAAFVGIVTGPACLAFFSWAAHERPYAPIDVEGNFIGILVVLALFGAAFAAETFRRLLSHPWLTAIGAWSYGLYLIHQEVGQKLIKSLEDSLGAANAPPGLSVATPLAAALVMVGFSWAIFQYWETPMKRRIVQFCTSRRAVGQNV